MIIALARHGNSRANVDDRICAKPENGTAETEGLSPVGRVQVQAAAADFANTLIHKLPNNPNVKLIASDFTRTRETAELIRDILQSAFKAEVQLLLDARFRERNFGDLEGKKGSEEYPKVWAQDALHVQFPSVESPESVASRSLQAVREYSVSFADADLLVFVAHGDTLQILQTQTREWADKVSPWEHRQLPHLETAEIRIVAF